MRTALMSLPRIDLKVKALTDYSPFKNDSLWEDGAWNKKASSRQFLNGYIPLPTYHK